MEDEELGALSSVTDAESEAMPGMTGNPQALAVLNSIRAEQKKRYDDYAARIRAARAAQQPTPTSDMSRLSGAFLAAGKPNEARSNWMALQQGVENWNQSGEAQKAAELKQRQIAAAEEAELAKAAFEQGSSLETLAAKYALAPPKQTAGYTTKPEIINNEPYVVYMPKDPTSGLTPYALGPGGKRVDLGPQGAPAPSAAPAAPAQAGAMAAGARPGGAPISQAEFLALPPEQRAGVEFVDGAGAIKRGTATGGTVEVAPAEARPAKREEAIARGFFSGTFKGTEFTPSSTDETNRVPDISALDADANRIDANIKDMQSFQKSLRDVVPLINSSTVGLGGFIAAFVPGTPAYRLKSVIDNYIGGNIAFDALQDMRVNSPTGGALGNVAIEELRALKQSAGNLDPGAGEESLRRGVLDVLAKYDTYIRAAQQQLGVRNQIKNDVIKARGLGVAPPSPAPAGGNVLRFDPKSGTFKPSGG
jgi:hypothetical protein